MADARRPGRPRKASAGSSPAHLGVVRVGEDFGTEYPDGEPLAAEVFATLVRTGQAIVGELDRAMEASFGASQPVLNALAVIEGAGEPLTPSQIGERTLTSSATMTSTLDTLERRGWARRVPNPDDRRSVLIEITPGGEAVADHLLPGIRALESSIIGALTKTERKTMLGLLDKVLAELAKTAEADPIPLEGRRVRPKRRG